MRTGQLELIRGQSDVCQKGRPLQGGTLPQSSELAGTAVATFQIGRTEVTWAEWKGVRDWAVSNGYPDLAGVGQGVEPDHPVQNVNWYDAVKWTNAKS